MRHTHMIAGRLGVALGAVVLAGSATASAQPLLQEPTVQTQDAGSSYVVLAKEGFSADSVAEQLRAAGATVNSVNAAIGMITVSTAPAGFLGTARGLAGVQGAATETAVGRSPKANPRDRVLKEAQLTPGTPSTTDEARQGVAAPSDPLDRFLWGMDMIEAPAAHRIEMGDKRVRVGILDTGVDATHPDLAPNFDHALSRNFVTDRPGIDGPCETATCVDPPTADDDGHGTHVAGTIAAAMNDVGVSGVAPDVGIVNIRGGQDSGYFFLGPVANALTYAADSGIDVVNMSFYVDPWLYNCAGGAPEDSPEAAAQQNLIMAVMDRALNYAHLHRVTLVAALGNNHEDLAKPRVDLSSPDYGGTPYPRTISNATCVDLPVEGAHVLGVAALGPSGKKSDFSNYTTQQRSGEIELSAPGGWFRDGFGTPSFMTYPNLILSAAPRKVLQDAGFVDANGDITPAGKAVSIKKSCTSSPVPGAAHCGFYQYLQGTSMASPHASGVAALAVSAHGGIRAGGFGMNPDAVKTLLTRTAIDHACPRGGIQSYTDEGRPAEYTARCVGTTAHNGFYGAGIANALGVVR